MANPREVGRGDVLRTLASAQDHLHVRLTATDPDVAEQHVLESHRIRPRNRHALAGRVDGHGREIHQPESGHVGLCRDRPSSQGDRDGLTR